MNRTHGMNYGGGRALIGTSGWSYDHWRHGVFYPERLASTKWLAYYAEHFPTVEINASFYRTPSENTVRKWRDTVPSDFEFVAKGSQFITHYRRLANSKESLDKFMERMCLLGEKLKIVLWQLPPNLERDLELLRSFLALLPTGSPRHALEFRNSSWLTEETFELLRAHGVANVQISSDKMPENLVPTADFIYLRFHGTNEYHGAYNKPAIEPWAAYLEAQLRNGRDCYVYFNNDWEGHAPRDAKRLMSMLASTGKVVRPSSLL